MITFRKAVLNDLDGMMRVVREARTYIASLGIDQWQDGYPQREVLENDVRLDRAYVCADEECIAAICVLMLEPEPAYDQISSWHASGSYLTIHRMAVGDAHRRAGLARTMLGSAVSIARENGVSSIRIDTHRGNAAMRGFLEKNGFAECGLVGYYDSIHSGDPMRICYDLAL